MIKAILLKPLDGDPEGSSREFDQTDFTRLEAMGAVRRAGLREDGPTIGEYVAAGYPAANYPPKGYASRSTPEEIAEAVAREKAAPPALNKMAPPVANKVAAGKSNKAG